MLITLERDDTEISEEMFTQLAEEYFRTADVLDSMEYESAPSGEFEEYNHRILVQEAVVSTY